MKKSKSLIGLFSCLVLVFTSCSNIATNSDDETLQNNDSTSAIEIGDELVYGEEFNLKELYADQARSAEISEDDMIDMVYFSVCPLTVDEVYAVNEKLGFLNPIEMNKNILQTCDAESLIFKKNVEITDDSTAEDLLNLGINYYYILSKTEFDEIKDLLENVTVIEEYSMIEEESDETTEAMEEISLNKVNRSIFTNRSISGTVKYSISGTTLPEIGRASCRERV